MKCYDVSHPAAVRDPRTQVEVGGGVSQHLVMWIVLLIIEITNYDSPVSQLLSLAVRILQPVTAMNRIPQLDKLMK